MFWNCDVAFQHFFVLVWFRERIHGTKEVMQTTSIVVLFLVLVLATTTVAKEECRKTFHPDLEHQEVWSSSTYDLTPLRNDEQDWNAHDGYMSYHVNFCAPVNHAARECGQAGICSVWQDDGTFINTFGTWDGTEEWTLLDDTDPEAGIKVTFKNGAAKCRGTIQMKTVLELPCLPKAKKPSPMTMELDFKTCLLHLTLASAASCPLVEPPSSASNAVHLGPGWICLVVLLVIVGAYIGAGCLVNRYLYKKQGCAACPQVEFWTRTLPALVRDGCLWTLKVCCRRQRSEYAPVAEGSSVV